MIESGKLSVFVGASRSGKSQAVKQELRGHRLALIWDIEGDYDVTWRVRSLSGLKKLMQRYQAKPPTRKEHIGYTGKLSDFPVFCQLAFWYINRMAVAGARTCLVFEETADVTSPGKAPESYGMIIRRGLKRGADILAVTQRPAESDKTTIGNASRAHICRIATRRDRKYIAESFDIPLTVIVDLQADQDRGEFDFIQVDTGKRFYQAGQLSFPGGKPRFKSGEKQPITPK